MNPNTPTALSAEQKADLRQKAQYATPGPWVLGKWSRGEESGLLVCPTTHGAPICRFDRMGRPDKDAADCGYILAAQPTTVLSLLDENAALAAQVAAARLDHEYEQQVRQQTEQAMMKLAEQVAGLKQELGLTTIHAETTAGHLATCESALAERDKTIAGLKQELAEQEKEKLELVKELLLAQDGRTTNLLTAELLTTKYKLGAVECPDCGSAVSLAGEFGCSCDALAFTPAAPAGIEKGGESNG